MSSWHGEGQLYLSHDRAMQDMRSEVLNCELGGDEGPGRFTSRRWATGVHCVPIAGLDVVAYR